MRAKARMVTVTIKATLNSRFSALVRRELRTSFAYCDMQIPLAAAAADGSIRRAQVLSQLFTWYLPSDHSVGRSIDRRPCRRQSVVLLCNQALLMAL